MSGGADLTGGLMVCGTASDTGKSLVVAGLCRLLARRGVRVAPFKAQNMSLNSYVTVTGHEIGRAQAAQAMAAGIEPEVAMNPVLLKPVSATSSQIVVMGRPVGDLHVSEFQSHMGHLRPIVLDALADLRSRFDVVVCEGAGGAAEINLLDGDIVNLPLAAEANLPAVIVGDIERGGVFAALYGTVAVLPERYQRLVKGFVINKFRGDPALLRSGLEELERRSRIPTLGVLPWLEGVQLDAEDSLALQGTRPTPDAPPVADTLDVAVIHLPHLSNFTDFDPLAVEPGVDVRMVTTRSLGHPDLLILPGTKSTVRDLAWLRERGLHQAIVDAAARPDGPVVLGICGGYQMLGQVIDDNFESGDGRCHGLALLEVETIFEATKVLRQRQGSALGVPVTGYQIHHGRTRRIHDSPGWVHLDDGAGVEVEGSRSAHGRVVGTSLHGLFEQDGFRASFLTEVARLRSRSYVGRPICFEAARRAQFDRLADALDAYVDVPALEEIIRLGPVGTIPGR